MASPEPSKNRKANDFYKLYKYRTCLTQIDDFEFLSYEYVCNFESNPRTIHTVAVNKW